MKNIKLLAVGILFPLFSYGTVLLDSDFEDGTMGGWVPKMSNECWEVSSDSTLQGSKNLKASTLGIADNIYAYTNVTYDLSSYTYEWKFMAKSSISDLSSGNTYWFWLAADKNDFNDSDIKGYVVGINYNGETDDELSVWKVNGTSDVTKIIDTDVIISNDALSIKVTRSSDGVWTLYYNKSNSFDSMTSGGTATDESITTGLTTCGPYFLFTASNSGKFRFDACEISRNQGISKPFIESLSSTNLYTHIGEKVTFDIKAIVNEASFGGLFSTNKPSGSTFTEQTGDFPLSSTFTWTPAAIGSYIVIFTSTNETGITTLPVNIEVTEVVKYNLWINEFHYDNTGGDVNEGIEIAGKAGIDLSNYTIYAYNGNNGEEYITTNLFGTLPNEDGTGYGAVWFAIEGLQNGNPDGLALVKDPEEVFYFISYGGSFEATDGPAAGMISKDVGVTEGSSTPTDYSLQLKGKGSYYEDFTWTAPSLYSHGKINDGQIIKKQGTVLLIK